MRPRLHVRHLHRRSRHLLAASMSPEPRFGVKHWSDGVVSSYSGSPPETPWEIDLGFVLENRGKNPAKNTRVFVSDFRAAKSSEDELELTSIELLELKRPLDMIPAGECVLVQLGRISGDTCELVLALQKPTEQDQADVIGADTRGCIRFSAKIYVSCDDKNSFDSFSLQFRPDKSEWASSFFEDYTDAHIDSVTRPKV
jgi:hypothetical protein